MKTFKTIEEQISYILDRKKIIVDDQYNNIFYQRNYISIINPYKILFSNGFDSNHNHIYPSTTKISELIHVAKLDDDFCKTLYVYIGEFEKEFKARFFYFLCLYLNCSDKSENNDINGRRYINEINEYINSGFDDSRIPSFCPHLYEITSKSGYVKNEYHASQRQDLLRKILEFNTIAFDDEKKKFNTENNLATHYLQTEGYIPLWVLPCVLSLGEILMLFQMADITVQANVVSLFNNSESTNISIQDIHRFSGIVEQIRELRNIVNHYEPIFPFLLLKIPKKKNMQNYQIYKTLTFLESCYQNSYIGTAEIDKLSIADNGANTRLLAILDFMIQYTK